MENPIKHFAKTRNLTGYDLAALAGVSPSTAYLALLGAPRYISRPILLGIEQAGGDIVKLQNDYARYQEWKRAKVRETILAGAEK